jgi:aspartate 1-decarboxylase
MLVEVLQAKIRYAKVTDANYKYKGSITIDEDILDEMGVVPWQVCDVNAMSQDQYGLAPFRGRTYIIAGERGSGCVECNGALAFHISKGDTVHINVYCQMPIESAKDHKPIIIESNEGYREGR